MVTLGDSQNLAASPVSRKNNPRRETGAREPRWGLGTGCEPVGATGLQLFGEHFDSEFAAAKVRFQNLWSRTNVPNSHCGRLA